MEGEQRRLPGRQAGSALPTPLTRLFIPSYAATMRNMSVLELLFALLLVCLLAGVGVAAGLGLGILSPDPSHTPDVARLETPGAALEQLAEPGVDATRRAQLTAQVEGEVERRVREVSQYIDPGTTSPFALAVIPDAAYDVCRSAIVSAHKRHVMVVGYAMALPYLLTLYQLHLQFARTVDMEKLQSALIDIERQVDVLEGILENKVQRSLTVLQNAYTEGKQASAKIRASTQSAQISSPSNGEMAPGDGAAAGDKVFSSPSHGEVARSAGGAAGDNVSTGSPDAAAELSTDTLRLALIDSVQ